MTRRAALAHLALSAALLLGLAYSCDPARGQEIVGPDWVAEHSLARLEIAWPEGSDPSDEDRASVGWVVRPLRDADFFASGDRLVVCGPPGEYEVIAGLVINGQVRFLGHTFVVEGTPGPGPAPTPTPDPTPDPAPVVPGKLFAVLLWDDATLTPEIAAIRSRFTPQLFAGLDATFDAYEVDSEQARRLGYTRELARKHGVPVPCVVVVGPDGTVHDAGPASTIEAVAGTIRTLRGAR